MARKRKRRGSGHDRLEVYRRIRKPMPPPEQVERDRRPELDEEQARREIEEAVGEDDER